MAAVAMHRKTDDFPAICTDIFVTNPSVVFVTYTFVVWLIRVLVKHFLWAIRSRARVGQSKVTEKFLEIIRMILDVKLLISLVALYVTDIHNNFNIVMD
jgi:hypothetical protein